MALPAFAIANPFPKLRNTQKLGCVSRRPKRVAASTKRIVLCGKMYPDPEKPEKIENPMYSENPPASSGETPNGNPEKSDDASFTTPPLQRNAGASSYAESIQKNLNETPQAKPVAFDFSRASRALWRIGWFSWWIQLILTIISAVILLFSFAFPGVNVRTSASVIGFILAGAGVIFSFVSLFWTYSYTRLSLSLNDAMKTTEQISARINGKLRFGMVLALLGLIVSLMGLQAIVGTLLARLFGAGIVTTPYTAYQGTAAAGSGLAPGGGIVQPIDIMIVQASANSMMALVTALTATVWLRGRQKSWLSQKS